MEQVQGNFVFSMKIEFRLFATQHLSSESLEQATQ